MARMSSPLSTDEIPLPRHLRARLAAYGLSDAASLAAVRRPYVLATAGIGRKTVHELERFLATRDLSFADDRDPLFTRDSDILLTEAQAYLLLHSKLAIAVGRTPVDIRVLASRLGILPERAEHLLHAALNTLLLWAPTCPLPPDPAHERTELSAQRPRPNPGMQRTRCARR